MAAGAAGAQCGLAGKMFALITGFMEAGESPQEGIAREVKEETNLDVSANLVGAYEFLRMNQVIIAYHVVATGEVRLSPELVDYRLYDLDRTQVLARWHRLCAGRLAAHAGARASVFYRRRKCRAAPWAGPAASKD
jgi:ADP-ribose pyrophosphatase YjhB (NUDIX family)